MLSLDVFGLCTHLVQRTRDIESGFAAESIRSCLQWCRFGLRERTDAKPAAGGADRGRSGFPKGAWWFLKQVRFAIFVAIRTGAFWIGFRHIQTAREDFPVSGISLDTSDVGMDVHGNDLQLPNLLDPQRFREDLLKPLFSLNEQLLDLLIAAAQTEDRASPLVAALYGSFRRLDATTRDRLSRTPLLVDAGFAIPERWSTPLSDEWPPDGQQPPVLSLARASVVALAQSTFVLAWHLIRAFPDASKLLLGMCDPCVSFFQQAKVGDALELSERRYEWVRPRWELQPEIWRELIGLARYPPKLLSGSVALRAMTRIAAETRRNPSDIESN